jgi:hypothetical protein
MLRARFSKKLPLFLYFTIKYIGIIFAKNNKISPPIKTLLNPIL